MKLSVGAETWAVSKCLQFQIAFCFLFAFFFFLPPYIQNEALCGSKWCIFQLLLWNCHFDGSRCCDNSHRINLSKTLNECRVFKHGATAHGAAGVWVKTCSFGGREREGGRERASERGGHRWALRRGVKLNASSSSCEEKKNLRSRWLADLDLKLNTVNILFAWFICPFTGQFKVWLPQYYFITSNTIPILQPWNSANTDINLISAHSGWYALSLLIFHK